MKKCGKILALLLTLCLAFSLCGGALAASGEPVAEPSGESLAQVDATHWAGSTITITGIEFDKAYADQDGKSYVDSTLFGAISKIIYEGGEINVDTAKYTAVLTVDGVQQNLYNVTEPRTYTGDVVITLAELGDTQVNAGAPFGADKENALFGEFRYTPAVYISAGAYDEAKSVTAAQLSGEIDDKETNGLSVRSEGDYFSAIYITDSDYTVNDSDITLYGRGGDDFNGWGAGIVVLGDSNVEINRTTIYGSGALRSGLFTSDSAQVTVNDSVIITENEEGFVAYDTNDNYAVPMMQQCPFAMGILGNIRASLACGAGCNIFTNALVASNGWAVLSTDSGRAGATALVANSMVAVLGEVSNSSEEMPEYDFSYDVNGETWYASVGRYGEQSGYIAYADSGVLDYAYGSAWYSPDYLGIVTTGTLTMADDCYGWSDRIGFMLHAGGGTSGTGTLDISDSSFNIRNIFAVSQSAGSYTSNISLTNVDIALANEGSDILFLQCDTDDHSSSPGDTSNTLTDITREEYASLEPTVLETSGEIVASTLTVKDSHVQGNVYNSATGGAAIELTLDNSELDGAISSAWSHHVDAEGNTLDETEFYCDSFTGTRDGKDGVWDHTMYLRLACEPAETRCNPVYLTMTNGAIWMVTGTNYLSGLTIDDSSEIKGMGLKMTVNGVETEIKAGSYEGEIILTAGEAPSRGEGGPELKAPVIGEAAELEVEAAEAFNVDLELAPFNVTVGDGMVLEFSCVQYSVGDGTISILIPDTAKQIDCTIVDGEWVMEGADFVDEAIIAEAKTMYEAQGGAPAAGESAGKSADGGKWDAWIAYLNGLLEQDTGLDIYERVKEDLAAVTEADYEGMTNGSVFGVFANLYNAIPFEDFVG